MNFAKNQLFQLKNCVKIPPKDFLKISAVYGTRKDYMTVHFDIKPKPYLVILHPFTNHQP
jgi:hypothetical protein